MSAYVIKGGTLYNPRKQKLYRGDLVLENGVIINGTPTDPYQVIDAAGCIVTTGLIDYHVHYFNYGTENGVNPDAASFPSGVTTAVDGGSCGVANYELYRKSIMSYSEVRILNALLVASGGQITDQYPERIEEEYMDKERIRSFFSRYSDNLVGLKTRLSVGIVEPGKAEQSLAATVELAQELGCPVIVHITNPAFSLEQLAGYLRAGDVICHVYQGKGRETILNTDGSIRAGIIKARERGVLFDACNGRNNYDLAVCQKALMQGFVPDIISSDMNTCGFYMEPLHSLPRVMSKYLDMGMTLPQVLDAATINPAKLINQEELADLEAGTTADIMIFRMKHKEIKYSDMAGNEFTGTQIIVPQMTIKDGKIMFCQADFA
ncbi:MAG: metallo-dependent hydrolase [Lachnospiraceae bacterium]